MNIKNNKIDEIEKFSKNLRKNILDMAFCWCKQFTFRWSLIYSRNR